MTTNQGTSRISSLRDLATRRLWRLPLWLYVLAAVIVAGALNGGNNEAESMQAEARSASPTTESSNEPARGQPALRPFAGDGWKAELEAIRAGNGSEVQKLDMVADLARDYEMTAADIGSWTEFLVTNVERRLIVLNANDQEYQYRLAFIARSIDLALDDSEQRAEDEFAFDVWQIARDLARGTETPGSSFVLSNLDQLDRAIAANGW